MEIEILNAKHFEEELKSDKPVLVDLWATWCGPCKMQAPILSEYALKAGDKVKVLKVDVDINNDIAYSYNVMSIPTLLLFINGELKEKSVGLTEIDEIEKMVNKHI